MKTSNELRNGRRTVRQSFSKRLFIIKQVVQLLSADFEFNRGTADHGDQFGVL